MPDPLTLIGVEVGAALVIVPLLLSFSIYTVAGLVLLGVVTTGALFDEAKMSPKFQIF